MKRKPPLSSLLLIYGIAAISIAASMMGFLIALTDPTPTHGALVVGLSTVLLFLANVLYQAETDYNNFHPCYYMKGSR